MQLTAGDILNSDIEIRGLLDIDQRPTGISPRRLPAWTRNQIPQELDVVSRMPSGVRLRFRTDSENVRLLCLTTRLVIDGAAPQPVMFNLESSDMLLAGEATGGNTLYIDRNDPTASSLDRGEPSIVEFEGLPAGEKNIELWIPHNAYVELRTLELDNGSRISRFTDKRPRWAHYGSSISHCMEALEPAKIWPAVAARAGGVDLQNLGLAGQCHVDQFAARTLRDLAPDLISLKIGINVVNGDTMRARVFVPAVHGFLDTIRERLPNTRIMVISPIYCPSVEEHPGPTSRNSENRVVTTPGMETLREDCLTLSRIRELLSSVVDVRKDENLSYLSGLELFGEADAADLPDDLHPNPTGYIRMGGRFAAHAFALGSFFAPGE